MIALNHGMMPLVTMPDGRPISLNKEWIVMALQQAALQHGYNHWSPAFALADALVVYLQQESEKNGVSFSYLEKILRDLLFSLQYDEIATSFFLPDPPTKLSLLDLAQEAGSGYELAFFQLLQQRLKEIAASKSYSLKIADLEPCLRSLSHRSRSRRHRPLREEIVNYVRACGSSSFFRKHRSTQHPLEIELS